MAEQNPDLLKQAAELNIQVTENATDEAIQAAIDEVLAEDGGATAPVDIATLRANYKAATGKPAFNGWDAAELQKRIETSGAAQTAKPAKQPKAAAQVAKTDAALIPVQVRRDFWDENGERHRKGTIVEVSVNAALDGVETGALSRVR